ncbi:MAG: BNR repeat-containing protein [Saprospiraceae bacterium]|nr:BNR repeat-containing protein [Saprospiraceae bacterium]
MKHLYLYILLIIFSQCKISHPLADITQHQKVTKVIKVADVWSGHPVGFDILDTESHQYIAYYDTARNMCIAQRKPDNDQWIKSVLPTRVGWDSHNSIVLAQDKKGFIHVSGNMHGVPLIYFRSKEPDDIDQFEKLSMVGTEEDRVTYPVFFKNLDDDLFFQYRDGGSGNGITYINRYNVDSKKWIRVLNEGLFDGEEETNAYPNDPLKGPDGYFHYMWVWRLNPIANTNHNLSYVRTKDFVHFENIEGLPIDIPIQYRERRVIADPVGPWNGLMNSTKQLSFDSKNRVVLGYHKFDKEGRSQLFICRYVDGEWINRQVSDWPDYTWDINKRGSLGHAISLPEIRTDGHGAIYFSYSHEKHGSGLLKIDEEKLVLLENMVGKKFSDVEGLPETKIPGMQINRKSADDGRYLLQWQTLPSNFDRPREPPYPKPTELILYELDKQ